MRSMLRNKTSTLISIGGLGLGMCCALLIFLYIQFELSYDSFHKKQDLIYRVLVKGEKHNSEIEYRSSIVYELPERLLADIAMRNSAIKSISLTRQDFKKNESPIQKNKHLENSYPRRNIPELPGSHYITDVVRMAPQSGYVSYKDKVFEEDYFYYTDGAIFRMFDFPLQKGNQSTALSEPGSIVLAPEMVEKYFQSENPIGKTIRFSARSAVPAVFKVTGILHPVPENSTMQIHFLASLPSEIEKGGLHQQHPLYAHTYIEFGGVKRRSRPTMFRTLLGYLFLWEQPIQVTLVANEFKRELAKILIQDQQSDSVYRNWHFTLEPFQDIYFAKGRVFTTYVGKHVETIKNGNLLSVLLLFALAFLLLAISCVNVMNLSTARSAGRAREIAIRKVMGADRRELIFQFLTESTLLSIISIVLALSMVEVLLPIFNQILHRELVIDYVNNLRFLLTIVSVALAAGFVSGIYPAFFLSSFPLLETMRGESISAPKRLRKWLIVFQISASACILIFSLFLTKESSFLRNKHPGFQTENILFFKAHHPALNKIYPGFKEELLAINGISHVTSSSFVAWEYGSTKLSTFSIFEAETGTAKKLQTQMLLVDPDFFDLYEIPIVSGENFTAISDKRERFCIINQTARRAFTLEQSAGKILHQDDTYNRQIIGVAKDFHYYYPWEKIAPLVIIPEGDYDNIKRSYISIRLSTNSDNQATGVIKQIEEKFNQSFPDKPFSYSYVDNEIDRIHDKMNNRWDLILHFTSAVAIFLAALGLAAFAEFEAERKTKEIGIRKALGGSRLQICLGFANHFVPMILLANIIAWGVSLLVIPRILIAIDYPWSFLIGLPVFMYSCSLTMLLCLLTIGIQIFRTASVEPSEALRDE